ncbi:hypothetical protein [Marichromatium bheemlicum]|uniref:Uncharacterized protein n=1 Tax=Marichromatium bheemlicum TaxID=365339 RepID=A0ABX1I543_9GAMM|nr:hypothetical protein [Marichromatium bheemlicum]NKN32552.1 hypothetical protein [Marichromatium bheemlicum]
MAAAETPKTRSVISWLPKFLLWGGVFVFAYLYWDSLEREGRELVSAEEASVSAMSQAESTTLGSVAAPSPAPAEVAVVDVEVIALPALVAEPDAPETVSPPTAAGSGAVGSLRDEAGGVLAPAAPVAPAPQVVTAPGDPQVAYQARLAAHHAALRRLARERMEQRWAPYPVVWPYPPLLHAPPPPPPFVDGPPAFLGPGR